MWLFYVILAGVLYAGQWLSTRYLLKNKNNDAWAFSFYFSLIGAIVSLPFMLFRFKIAGDLHMWLIMILIGVLIVTQNLLTFQSARFVEASVSGVILKFRLVWIFIFGTIILGETFSFIKVIGTGLTIVAGLFLIQKLNKPKSLWGILLSFSSTIFYAVVIILYKFLFTTFNPQSLTFFIFFIPAIINLIIMPHSISRVRTIIKHNPRMLLFTCILGAFSNLAMNIALSLGQVTKVNVIMEAFLVLIIVGEYYLLKEKENTFTKAIAVILVLIGAVLTRIAP